MALLFGLVLPLAAVFFALIPLQDARKAAAEEVRSAENLSAWVSDQATVSAALLARVPQESTQSVGVIGISGIEKTLQDSGLRPFVTRLAARDGGGVELALEGVEFRSLSDWLDAVEPGWGYTLQSFRFEASDTPGTILAEFQLGVEQ